MASELAQLVEVRAARTRLDEQELELIERARHEGVPWTQIATVLGLTSRQAAQQRHQRLVAALRSRRRALDVWYSPSIARLRAAVAELHRWISADRRWDSRFARAALVRATVTAALDAAPGSLYALASHVAADITGPGTRRLPKPVQLAVAEVRAALSTDD